jgi:outer membrane protein
MKKTAILTIIFLMQLPLSGKEFSLKQSIEYALSNNSDIKISTYDKAIAQKKVDEQIGTALPQISISGSLNDNLTSSTQSLSIQDGTEYSNSTSAQLQQKIYDPTFSAGLKALKISNSESVLNLEKTREEIIYSISRIYYQTLVIQKQKDVLSRILDVTKETLNAVELKYRNGSAKKIDIDKVRVNYNNAYSRVQQSELSYKQYINNMKCQMGMSVDSVLVLSDTLNSQPEELDSNITDKEYWKNRIDYKLLKSNLNLRETEKKSYIASYLPSLSLSAAYSYQSSSEQLNFKDEWYTNANVELSLSIPVFDGFQKRARLAQSNLTINKAREDILAAEQSIKTDVSNYEIQYRIALANLSNEKDNLTLSEDVYKNTQLSYLQGAESTYELIQAENSMREAQKSYFDTILSYYLACLDLEKSKGKLLDFVNSMK